MGIELVVLDFDGTLTEVDKEAIPFVNGYKNDVARDLNIDREELEERWAIAQLIVESDQSLYGWVVNGDIVAPAYADPLILSKVIASLLLDNAELYVNNHERQEALERYFQGNYERMDIFFKEGVDEFICSLHDEIDICIVTNSETNNVAKKIKLLKTEHSDVPIYGDAKKYLLNNVWEGVPKTVEREGYGRPLFLRRQKYWDVLSKIMEQRNIQPEQVVVVGDIYELDLLLPEHKGMRTVLTPRESTPRFEIDAAKFSTVGHVAWTLGEVLEYLKSQR